MGTTNFLRFCGPGQERVTFTLVDNIHVPIENIEDADTASFVFSEAAYDKFVTNVADGVPKMKTVTDWCSCAIEPLVKQMEMSFKPTPTDDQKRAELVRINHPAMSFMELPDDDELTLISLARDGNTQLHALCLKFGLLHTGNVKQKLARLKAYKASKYQNSMDQVEEAMRTVLVDTMPSWCLEYKLSLAVIPTRGGAGAGPSTIARKCETAWWPGCPEPDTSIKFANKLAALNKQTDANNRDRLRIFVHWRRRQATPPPPTPPPPTTTRGSPNDGFDE
jgi:hypothetical protein